MYAETEVQGRQQLNCEHALALCRTDKVLFLLHLDSDELLHVPFEYPPEEVSQAQVAAPAAGQAGGQAGTGAPPFIPPASRTQDGTQGDSPPSTAAAPAREQIGLPPPSPPASWHRVLLPARAALFGHLARLDQLGALQYTYLNHEAVPEREECTDPFLAVSLFKRHPSRLPARNPAAERAMAHWTKASAAGGQFFGFYTNGKSLVRADHAPITTVREKTQRVL
jgi:hypothetical protein